MGWKLAEAGPEHGPEFAELTGALLSEIMALTGHPISTSTRKKPGSARRIIWKGGSTRASLPTPSQGARPSV